MAQRQYFGFYQQKPKEKAKDEVEEKPLLPVMSEGRYHHYFTAPSSQAGKSSQEVAATSSGYLKNPQAHS